ncbi:MAG: ABC transporter permease subunit [Anaerolineales bacterium]|nr:ABC transporter permease subunit [Anaerolineales bacterium]
MDKKPSIGKSIRVGLIVVLCLIVYAYGFQVTQVSFKEISSERRQESLTRVLRALAKPNLVEYEQKETVIKAPIYVPCTEEGAVLPEPDKSQPYLVLAPACADPRTEIQIEGYNFTPNSEGSLYFVPPSEVNLNLGSFKADDKGAFSVTAKVPPRPETVVQYVHAVSLQRVGSPTITQTAIDTWDKIVETIFLALLATTLGVIFSIPVSFLAARNIMKEITSPISSLSLSIIGWPVGIGLGVVLARWLSQQSQSIYANIWLTLLAIIILCVIAWYLIRWAMPQEETRKPKLSIRITRIFALGISGIIMILVVMLVAKSTMTAGTNIVSPLGAFGFLGSFLSNMGEIINLIIPIIVGLGVGALVSNFFSKIGKWIYLRFNPSLRLIANIVLSGLAGATIFIILGNIINWFYQINDPIKIFYVPAVVGALCGIALAIWARKEDAIPVGMAIYYITRTLLNATRAIEALIWVIVFVVWVGIGPFAGVLALSLHTVAALAKLYSEQVESISPGPLEAVRATGATRLQMIIYAVIPQIIPPYISFTMYRWDINVRMSTIIGFGGGGGIGFLLIQNINTMQYRAASAQMLAIAIVVALMDYLSSYMREKVV